LRHGDWATKIRVPENSVLQGDRSGFRADFGGDVGAGKRGWKVGRAH
jgi:hypothetical protein